MAQKGEALVEVKDLCKNFGVTIALSHVDFVVKTGEIRGLIGENGSGKSTVSSIIAGMQPANSGEMFYKGKPWKPATMLEAQKAGIGMIVQEAGTIANISVAENIFLGNYDKFKKGPIINKMAMISEARKALEKIGVTNINPALPARHYDMQERKLIEIAKCMYNDPELLIVDETTTALGMDVMLATVLGGMSIFGGSRSNAYAGLLGALTVAALNKGLLMVGVSSAFIQGIRGVIFLLLVWMNSERQNLLPSRVQF